MKEQPNTPKSEAVLLVVQAIIVQLHRSPGLSNGPFSLDGWTVIRDALEETIAQSERKAWIDVGERLPHPHSDNDYIVATRSGYVCALNFGEQGWYGPDGEESGRDGYWNGCVTHWQELPEAPVENKATTLAERVTEFVRRAINDRWMKDFGPVWGERQEAMYADVREAISNALASSPPSASVERKPVAWRYRYKANFAGEKHGAWKYADSFADVNQSGHYEFEPLFAPLATEASQPFVCRCAGNEGLLCKKWCGSTQCRP